jgi:hypothetical protein
VQDTGTVELQYIPTTFPWLMFNSLRSLLNQTASLVACVCPRIWLRRLLNELNMSQGKAATIIRGDNQGAIALSSNPQYHSRTKHMDGCLRLP